VLRVSGRLHFRLQAPCGRRRGSGWPLVRPGAGLSASLHVLRHGLKAMPPPLLPEPDKPTPGLRRGERARGKGTRNLRAVPPRRRSAASRPHGRPDPARSHHRRRRTGLSASGSRGGGAGAVFVQARGLIRAGGHGVRRTNPSCAGPRGTNAARHPRHPPPLHSRQPCAMAGTTGDASFAGLPPFLHLVFEIALEAERIFTIPASAFVAAIACWVSAQIF
jgi:hypothetical protein